MHAFQAQSWPAADTKVSEKESLPWKNSYSYRDSSAQGIIHTPKLSTCQQCVVEFCLSIFDDCLFFHLFSERKHLQKLRTLLAWISQEFSSAFMRWMWKQMVKNCWTKTEGKFRKFWEGEKNVFKGFQSTHGVSLCGGLKQLLNNFDRYYKSIFR